MSMKAKASNDMTVTIPLLTSKNYYTWIPIVRAHLRRNRLWQYTQEEFRGKDAEAKDWKEKTMEAADAITPTLSKEISLRLYQEDFDDGYRMWNHIREIIQPTGESEWIRLNKELFRARFYDFESADQFFTHIKTLSEQIEATQVTMTNDRRILLVLSMACPSVYSGIAQLWQNMKDITPDQVIQMLKKEIRRHDRAEENEQERDYGDQPRHGLFAKKCRKCKKTGHKEEDCWKDLTCEECGKKGHPADRCYDRIGRPEDRRSKTAKIAAPVY